LRSLDLGSAAPVYSRHGRQDAVGAGRLLVEASGEHIMLNGVQGMEGIMFRQRTGAEVWRPAAFGGAVLLADQEGASKTDARRRRPSTAGAAAEVGAGACLLSSSVVVTLAIDPAERDTGAALTPAPCGGASVSLRLEGTTTVRSVYGPCGVMPRSAKCCRSRQLCQLSALQSTLSKLRQLCGCWTAVVAAGSGSDDRRRCCLWSHAPAPTTLLRGHGFTCGALMQHEGEAKLLKVWMQSQPTGINVWTTCSARAVKVGSCGVIRLGNMSKTLRILSE
jgi:hypothetical protein